MGTPALRPLSDRTQGLPCRTHGERDESQHRQQEAARRQRALQPPPAAAHDNGVQGADGGDNAEGVRADCGVQPVAARRLPRREQRTATLLLPHRLRQAHVQLPAGHTDL